MMPVKLIEKNLKDYNLAKLHVNEKQALGMPECFYWGSIVILSWIPNL
jgi:hypothetical protein